MIIMFWWYIPIALLLSTSTAFLPLQMAKRRESQRRMFTGIIEEMGKVVSLEERDDMPLWDGTKGKGTELVVEANVVMEGAYLG
jgi:hypothetical protein